jgi:hypothetical protein
MAKTVKNNLIKKIHMVLSMGKLAGLTNTEQLRKDFNNRILNIEKDLIITEKIINKIMKDINEDNISGYNLENEIKKLENNTNAF